MDIIGKDKLHNFKERHSETRSPLDSWEALVEGAIWNTSQDVKNLFPRVDMVAGVHAIFDIRKNKYRLWVQITYKTKIVLVRKIGTHREYNKWQRQIK